MVNYHCPRCGYETTHFVTYKRHLQRKKICENKLSDDDLIGEYKRYEITEKLNAKKCMKITTKYHNLPQNATKLPQNYHKIPQNSTYLKCQYCEKVLSRRDSLERHMKKCNVGKELEKERNEMNKIVDLLNRQLEDQKIQLEKRESQIDELIKKTGNTTINYQQNNVNTNIKLLGYRNTDISHLSDKDFISCISHSNFCIPHLIKKIHFDPDKPENHNIYISNIKNNYAMIYDGDKWNLTNKDDLINEILEEKEIIIEEKLEEWLAKEKQYPEIMKKFTRYLEKKENDVVLDKIKDEVKLVLFNNRNIIKS